MGPAELGVDILARKDGEEVHIEVIAYSDKPPTRSRQFYEALLRRIGEAFPELFIWLVDCRNLDAPTYQVSQWNDWLT